MGEIEIKRKKTCKRKGQAMANERLVLTKRFINGLNRETKRRYLEQFELPETIEENIYWTQGKQDSL